MRNFPINISNPKTCDNVTFIENRSIRTRISNLINNAWLQAALPLATVIDVASRLDN